MYRSVLVDPVFLLLVSGLSALLIGLRWRRLGTLLVFATFAALYLLSTEYVSSNLLARVEPPLGVHAPVDPANPPAAIVVLSGGLRKGAPELGGDTIGEDTLERVRRAAQLWRETRLPLLVSGGRPPGAEKTLAETMAEALERDFDIPVSWQEDKSLTTFENAKFSAQMLGAAGINSIYLVTYATHMPRAVEIFERWGFRVVPVPTGFTVPVKELSLFALLPRSYYLAASGRAVRELIGDVAYRLMYDGI